MNEHHAYAYRYACKHKYGVKKTIRYKALLFRRTTTPFSGQFRRQCMHFENSAGNFGGSAVRRPVGYDSAATMSKLVALLPNYMQIVQNWSEKGVGLGTGYLCHDTTLSPTFHIRYSHDTIVTLNPNPLVE